MKSATSKPPIIEQGVIFDSAGNKISTTGPFRIVAVIVREEATGREFRVDNAQITAAKRPGRKSTTLAHISITLHCEVALTLVPKRKKGDVEAEIAEMFHLSDARQVRAIRSDMRQKALERFPAPFMVSGTGGSRAIFCLRQSPDGSMEGYAVAPWGAKAAIPVKGSFGVK